jgi:phosphomannomutase
MSAPFHFGTAGIPAPLGAGAGQLNRESVRRIAGAILEQLAARVHEAHARGLCVGFDGRAQSREFAAEIAALAQARGFRVRAFEHEAPTPLLAFCTRLYDAAAGIMVTASHNPASDNGIKLYLAGGLQVGAPHDGEIEARMASATQTAEADAELAAATAGTRLSALGAAETQAYLEAVVALVPCRPELALPRLAYTATCGVGTATTRALLSRIGARELVEVMEQAAPRADFGGLASPNPEAPEALERVLALAQRESAPVAFAHDPDADRLAVAVRGWDGSMRPLSGDELGALLGDFLLELHPAPARTLLVSSHVSGGLLEQIARARGANYLRTPTGFKWIAARGREHAAREQLELLFGYEEALGYAFFAMADDKDGIAALYVACELLRRLWQRGESFEDRLDALARAHGAFVSRQLSLPAVDAAGNERVASVLDKLRALDPRQLLGPDTQLEDHARAPAPLSLLVFRALNGTRVCVRPSGTEPKLKFYLQAREDVAPGEPVAQARERASSHLQVLEQQLRALISSDTPAMNAKAGA